MTTLVRCYRSPDTHGALNARLRGQLTWHTEDPRLELGTEAVSAESLDLLWPRLCQQAHHDGKQALLWMREDVEVHDHFLVDRILELGVGSWLVLDSQGRTALRAQVGTHTDSHPIRIPPLSVAFGDSTAAHTSPTLTDVPELLVVTASRVPPGAFYTQTALGRSVQTMRRRGARIRVMAICNNQLPLAHAYNRVLTSTDPDSMVAFIHDDVTLHDWHLNVHLHAALEHYDLVGVAGSKILHPRQPSWAFPARIGQWAKPGELLGSVGHDTTQQPNTSSGFHGLSRYGAPKGAAVLLDGVFLACHVKTLTAHGLRFDPDLPFHFYDLDLCRQALSASLRCGVWPLAITHHSGGRFQSPEWQRCYQHYLNKWESAH